MSSMTSVTSGIVGEKNTKLLLIKISAVGCKQTIYIWTVWLLIIIMYTLTHTLHIKLHIKQLKIIKTQAQVACATFLSSDNVKQ